MTGMHNQINANDDVCAENVSRYPVWFSCELNLISLEDWQPRRYILWPLRTLFVLWVRPVSCLTIVYNGASGQSRREKHSELA